MGKTKELLTHALLLEALDYDPASGSFHWKDGRKRDVGNIDRDGRLQIRIGFDKYPAHRLAWFYVHGVYPDQYIVPRNGDYLDLRIENLEQKSAQEMAFGWSARRDNKSGHRGVTWDKSRARWTAGIGINGKRKGLGRFKTKEEAVAAVEAARAQIMQAPTEMVGLSTEARLQARENARMLSLWRRTLRSHGDYTGWSSFAEFRSEIGDAQHRGILQAKDISKRIGPGNWVWSESLYSKFNTRTTAGKTAYEFAYRQRNPFVKKNRDLRQTFGITVAEFHAMRDAQGGVCAACGRPEKEKRSGRVRELAVDHCHRTGAIRGLLCGNCNRGIGKFEDNPELLRKAADYLERFMSRAQVPSVPLNRAKKE